MKPNKNTIHPLCSRCIKTCKQTVAVKLLTCPLYEHKMSDDEFSRLLDEMEEISRQATALHHRVSRLIDDMQVKPETPPSDDAPEDASGTAFQEK